MIRITCREDSSTKSVRIAGRLEERHLSRLEKTCNTSDGPLILVLSELQSADSVSIQWLHARTEQDAAIIGASPFIALLLERAAGRSRKPSVDAKR